MTRSGVAPIGPDPSMTFWERLYFAWVFHFVQANVHRFARNNVKGALSSTGDFAIEPCESYHLHVHDKMSTMLVPEIENR